LLSAAAVCVAVAGAVLGDPSDRLRGRAGKKWCGLLTAGGVAVLVKHAVVALAVRGDVAAVCLVATAGTLSGAVLNRCGLWAVLTPRAVLTGVPGEAAVAVLLFGAACQSRFAVHGAATLRAFVGLFAVEFVGVASHRGFGSQAAIWSGSCC